MTENNNKAEELSTHDQEILSRIFSQELFDRQKPAEGSSASLKNRKLNELEERTAQLEVKAINAAEVEKDLNKALIVLNEAITMAPLSYPSPYNNRAQVYRLFKPPRTTEACADLEKAIELSGDDFPLVRRQSLSQRAWIKYGEGKNEEAFADFEAAAKLGCEDSRRMAVKCNPYARLCNDMMQEMLNRLYYSNPSSGQK